jgi:hypothetical protein
MLTDAQLSALDAAEPEGKLTLAQEGWRAIRPASASGEPGVLLTT